MNLMGHRGRSHVGTLSPLADDRHGRSSRSGRARGRRERTAAPTTAQVSAAPPLNEIADEAVSAFRLQALGRRCGTGDDADAFVRVVVRAAGQLVDATRLEVWVLLGGVADAHVPARWDPTEVVADPELTSWALTLRAALIGHLVALDWPAPELVTVRFDTADRVERRGGRHYVAA